MGSSRDRIVQFFAPVFWLVYNTDPEGSTHLYKVSATTPALAVSTSNAPAERETSHDN